LILFKIKFFEIAFILFLVSVLGFICKLIGIL